MRRETAKRTVELLDNYLSHTCQDYGEDNHEAMMVAIKALEQEPCDAVSRQAVNDLVDELARAISDERGCISRGRSTATIMQDILDLSSVTPKQRTGKWIDDKCSVCGKGIEDLISSPEWYRNEEPKFCPYCGVKLEGESEDKE